MLRPRRRQIDLPCGSQERAVCMALELLCRKKVLSVLVQGFKHGSSASGRLVLRKPTARDRGNAHPPWLLSYPSGSHVPNAGGSDVAGLVRSFKLGSCRTVHRKAWMRSVSMGCKRSGLVEGSVMGEVAAEHPCPNLVRVEPVFAMFLLFASGSRAL